MTEEREKAMKAVEDAFREYKEAVEALNRMPDSEIDRILQRQREREREWHNNFRRKLRLIRGGRP
jgi:thiamine biosynthesis lipoprotein ApbE